MAYTFPIVYDNVPFTYREAINSSESIQWKLAIDEEMQSFHKNGTWKLVTLSMEKKGDWV